MPRFAQLFKDTSPPLIWSEGWQGGTSEADPALDKYASISRVSLGNIHLLVFQILAGNVHIHKDAERHDGL